jgi:hypothetical protein
MDEGEVLDIAGSVAGKNAVTQLVIASEQTITLRHIVCDAYIQRQLKKKQFFFFSAFCSI